MVLCGFCVGVVCWVGVVCGWCVVGIMMSVVCGGMLCECCSCCVDVAFVL